VESDTRNFYPASLYPNDFKQFNYERTVNNDISGFNALFGLMFRKPGKYSIGFAIRTATTYDFSATFTEAATSQFKTPDDSTGLSSYEYPLISLSTKFKATAPYVLSAGVSVQPFDWLVLAGDAEYTDWTQMELDGGTIDLSSENSQIKNHRRRGFTL
jgi:long-subunit fatty acid transport protein